MILRVFRFNAFVKGGYQTLLISCPLSIFQVFNHTQILGLIFYLLNAVICHFSYQGSVFRFYSSEIHFRCLSSHDQLAIVIAGRKGRRHGGMFFPVFWSGVI